MKFFITLILPLVLFLCSALPAHAVVQGASCNVSSQSDASVTTTSTQFLAASLYRTCLVVQNKDTSATIYLKFGSASTSTEGIAIPPNGVYEPQVVPSNSIWLLSSSGTVTARVYSGN